MDFFVRHDAPFKASFLKQDVHLKGMIVVALGPVDVKNSASLMIEVDMFVFRHRKQLIAGGDGKPSSSDGVGFVLADVPDEFRHPRRLVPIQLRIDQKGRITPQHPGRAEWTVGPSKGELR